MNNYGWGYYNHAMIPTTPPWVEANMEPITNKYIWKLSEKNHPLLARWVSDYDCGYNTEWWYCIKDDEYEIESLTAKKRYRVTKGRRCFDVKVIDETDLLENIIDVYILAYSSYPVEIRPSLNRERIKDEIDTWKKEKHVLFGAFKRITT